MTHGDNRLHLSYERSMTITTELPNSAGSSPRWDLVIFVKVIVCQIRDCLQILFLILSEFKQINYFLVPLKSSENHS